MKVPVGLFVAVALSLAPAAARAHGDLSATVPEKGSTLRKPIKHLAITFTQAPTTDAVIRVTDGCRRNVVDRVDLEDRVAHVYLRAPQPGKWSVSYRVVSSVDGHESHDRYALTVKGKADCSSEGGDAGDGGNDSGPDAAGDEGPVTEDDGSSFPVVPVALGTVAVLGLAFVVRRTSR